MFVNELQLSKRLQTVASFIPKGSVLADIGSDHAYLPCYAYLHGYITKAIAGEVADGPFRSAKQQVEKSGLSHVISVRKGDGLQVVALNEVDCITIAGMGGTLISNILENGKEKLEAVKRLILQPNVGAHIVRQWLLNNEWELIDERILEEDGQIYEVLVAERGDPYRPYNQLHVEMLLGPFLLKERNEVFRKKWDMEMKHWQNVIEQLKYAKTDEAIKKKQQFLETLQMVEEALKR